MSPSATGAVIQLMTKRRYGPAAAELLRLPVRKLEASRKQQDHAGRDDTAEAADRGW